MLTLPETYDHASVHPKVSNEAIYQATTTEGSRSCVGAELVCLFSNHSYILRTFLPMLSCCFLTRELSFVMLKLSKILRKVFVSLGRGSRITKHLLSSQSLLYSSTVSVISANLTLGLNWIRRKNIKRCQNTNDPGSIKENFFLIALRSRRIRLFDERNEWVPLLHFWNKRLCCRWEKGGLTRCECNAGSLVSRTTARKLCRPSQSFKTLIT